METTEKKIKLLIASRQIFTRLGIKTLLSVLGIELTVEETQSIEELTKLLNNGLQPDFVIVNDDILLSHRKESITTIWHNCPNCKLMVIGGKAVRDCSCSQFVLNTCEQKEILEKFQDFFFKPEIKTVETESSQLSDREAEVLKEIALGFSNKEVAEKLYISINTVITHRKNITNKLGIKTISGLTVYALLNNLIHAEEVQ